MVATELALLLGHDLGFTSVDDVTDAIAANVPGYAGATRAALARQRDGVVTTAPPSSLPDTSSHALERNSYDYRLVVSRTLYDEAIGTAMSPSLAPLARGAAAFVHPLDLVCVEPTMFRKQVKAVLVQRSVSARPSGSGYATFLSVARLIANKLAEQGEVPRDLMDVRSFIVLTMKPASKARPKRKAAREPIE